MARRMIDLTVELALRDAIATDTLGAALARALGAVGPGLTVLYLQGELGAGKTTCVRSLLRALGVEGPIRSPTYTLVEAYELPRGAAVHVDLYRLQGAAEVEELGLRDYVDGGCLLLVEWPDKGGRALAPADVELRLTYDRDARRVRLSAGSARGRDWLDKLVRDTSLTPYVSNLT